jgi:hypothetical protein
MTMAKVRIEAERLSWETPMSNAVTDVAVALRESMEALGWSFERERSERIYSQFAVIMPYVFRFRVTDPLPDVCFDAWEMRLTHRGDISYLAVKDHHHPELPQVRTLLGELVSRLPRRPWDFPLGQRLEAGLVIPEWSTSRKQWAEMGFDTSERTPKAWTPKGSLGARMRSELGEQVGGTDEADGGADDDGPSPPASKEGR